MIRRYICECDNDMCARGFDMEDEDYDAWREDDVDERFEFIAIGCSSLNYSRVIVAKGDGWRVVDRWTAKQEAQL